MMKIFIYIIAIFLTMIMMGCNSIDGVSKPMAFPASSQYKLKSVAHWQLIAQDVATQTAKTLTKNKRNGTPLYLHTPELPSPFERNFLPMLRSALLERGIEVRSKADSAAGLQIRVDKVAHASVYRTGTLFFLTGGLLVLRDIVTHGSYHLTAEGGLLGAVAAEEMMQTRRSTPPEIELILSVTVQRDGQYLISQNHIYYLASEDIQIYEKPEPRVPPPPRGRTFGVQGVK